MSGPDAGAIAVAVLHQAVLPAVAQMGAAQLDLGGGALLDLELLRFEAPRSATGEHVIELHLPGWPPVVADLLARLVAAGARPAARGEFTRRALACGRVDLAGALAVGVLAASRSAEEAGAAASVLVGDVALRGRQLRAALLDLLALIEAHVDFEEQDTEAVGPAELQAGWERVLQLARRVSAQPLDLGNLDGETDVVVLGAPNAGKSSLVAALCPDACAAISPLAGTTRDLLEARVEAVGRRWRLLDGPGIDHDDSQLCDLDRQAMDHFLAQLPENALVLHLQDAGRARGQSDGGAARRLAAAGPRTVLTVLSRADLLTPAERPPGLLALSAHTGEGLPQLWDALRVAAPTAPMPWPAREGERAAAAEVLALLEHTTAQGGVALELPLLSLALREAFERLERDAERPQDLEPALLDRIFARFCIGK